jgi:predicted lipoprotein
MLTITLASCVPWTVRPLEGERQQQSSAVSPKGNPGAYVESVWDSRLVPAVTNSAVDARVLLEAIRRSSAEARTRYGRPEGNGAAYFIIKGEGTVTAVDTRSRVGLALIDIAPFDGRADVSVQIGPVIRGTSLRDATGIIRFSDFVNQLQFADAANEINNRVLATVIAPLDIRQIKGRKVSFAGTAPVTENSAMPLAELVPVTFNLEATR